MLPAMRLVPAALVLALPAVAFAQAPGMYDPTRPLAPPGMTPPEGDRDEPPHRDKAPAPAEQPVSPLAAYSARDAAADRAFGTSTAVALPSGKIDVSGRASYFGGIGSLAAGLGSGLEVSVDIASITDDASMVGGGVKLVLVQGQTTALAATASYHHVNDSCYDCSSSDDALWAVGGVLSTCVGENCSSLFSVGGGVMGVTDSGSNNVGYLSASLVAGTGGFRPILEGAALLGEGGGILGFAGARMGGKKVAFDGGIGFLLSSDGESDGGAAAPMIGLSVRP
jgi:hypothetical protein